jgi:hypothetical protein
LEPKKKKQKIVQVDSRKCLGDDARVLPLMTSHFSFKDWREINTKPDKKKVGQSPYKPLNLHIKPS